MFYFFYETGQRTRTKIGVKQTLPEKNWGQISARSVKGFYNRRLDESAAVDQDLRHRTASCWALS